METRQYIVYRKRRTQAEPDFLHHFTFLRSSRDVRLIADDEEKKFAGLQARQCIGRAGGNLEFIR